MKRVVWAVAAAVLAAAGLSACGSSEVAPASAPHVDAQGAGSIVFVAGGQSAGLGVDNTDLIAATASGDVRDLTSSAAGETHATWSADGSHVVFIRKSTTGQANGGVATQAGVYVWTPGHGAPQRVASCSTYCFQNEFAWSPDDRQIAFVGYTGHGLAIDVMDADGSGLHTICDPERCGQALDGPMWSPDGRKLVFSNGGMGPIGPYDPPSSIWIANADGSGVERLTQPNCNDYADEQRGTCSRDTAPVWSPNGRLILPPAWSPNGKAIAYAPVVDRHPRSFRITTLAGKTTTVRTCAGSHCLSPSELTWSPNGRQLTFIAGGSPYSPDVWVIGRDGAGLRQIAAGVQWGSLAWVRRISLSGAKTIPKNPAAEHLRLSGTIAYDELSANLDYRLGLLSLGTTRAHELRVPPTQCFAPSWSPDGREIAGCGQRGEENRNIRVSDRNGKNVRVLTLVSRGGVWSPDGRSIAFTRSERGIRSGVGLVWATGGRIRSVTADGADPSWSPNSRELVFQRQLSFDNNIALFTIRPDGTGLRRLTNLPGEQRSPAWSPDGKEIAFEWLTPAGLGLYLIQPDGTHLRRVTTAPLIQARSAWSPDSRYLVVFSPQGGPTTRSARVLVIDVKSGRVSTVATVPGEAADPSWSSR